MLYSKGVRINSKLTVGAASVLIGVSFLSTVTGETVKADTTSLLSSFKTSLRFNYYFSLPIKVLVSLFYTRLKLIKLTESCYNSQEQKVN